MTNLKIDDPAKEEFLRTIGEYLIGKLELGPDDIVVVKTKREITDELVSSCAEWGKFMFAGHKVALLGPGDDLQIVHPTEKAA